jgi:hypothetical protein
MTDQWVLLIVVIAFLLVILLLVKNFSKKVEPNQSLLIQGELLKQKQSIFLPYKAEAFQRVILYLERIHPSTLSFRLIQPNMNAIVLQSLMLKAIREEFDHNVAQQLYISTESWSMLKNAKEETVKIINIAASQMKADSTANDLATAIISVTAEVNPLPSEIALEMLKKEWRTVAN